MPVKLAGKQLGMVRRSQKKKVKGTFADENGNTYIGELKDGIPLIHQSGLLLARMFLKMHMLHGKQQYQQKFLLRQTLAMIHAAAFATGKPGVHIGGIGDTKPTPFTKEIFLIL